MAALSKSSLRSSSRRDRVVLHPRLPPSSSLLSRTALPPPTTTPPATLGKPAAAASQQYHVAPRPGKRPRAVSHATRTNNKATTTTTSSKHHHHSDDLDGSNYRQSPPPQRASKRLKTTHTSLEPSKIRSTLPLRKAEKLKSEGGGGGGDGSAAPREHRSLTANARDRSSVGAAATAAAALQPRSNGTLYTNGVHSNNKRLASSHDDDDDDDENDDDGDGDGDGHGRDDHDESRPRKHRVAENGQSRAEESRCGENDKRMLRSHDGVSRSKSELSLYFPNYEDLINNEPKATGKSFRAPRILSRRNTSFPPPC